MAGPAWGDKTTNRVGYDGAGRMIAKRYLDATAGAGGYSSTASLVGFTTAFDRSSNKLYERHLHAVRRSHRYTWHDSLNRLRAYERGTLASGGGSVTEAINVENTDKSRAYVLDGLGNWRRTVFTPEDASEATTEARQHNYVNQLTEMGETAVTYDHGANDDGRAGNGNVDEDGTRKYEWDALNRLKRVWKKDDPDVLIATYSYDGLGRRIRRKVENNGLPNVPALNGTTDFLYFGIRCMEERSDADAELRQYVWGRYVDELIQQKELTGGDVGTYYLLSDLLYRSVALTDASKTIQEAYDCDAYGRTLLFSADGGSGWFSHDDTQALTSLCRFLFTGRSHDAETSETASQLYLYRARYYQTEMGRFVLRDPADYAHGTGLYEYVASSPAVRVDPLGLGPMNAGAKCVPGDERIEVLHDYGGICWLIIKTPYDIAHARCIYGCVHIYIYRKWTCNKECMWEIGAAHHSKRVDWYSVPCYTWSPIKFFYKGSAPPFARRPSPIA